MYIKEKQSKTKLTVTLIILGVLLVAVIGVLTFILTNNQNKDKLSKYQVEGLTVMEKPCFNYSDAVLTFGANISPELYEEVMASEDKAFGMFIAPESYFAKAEKTKGGDCDWLSAFDDLGYDTSAMDLVEVKMVTTPEGTLQGYKMEIDCFADDEINTEFVAMAFVTEVTEDGESYKYSTFENGKSYSENAYSLAYIVAEELNKELLGFEKHSYSEKQILQELATHSVVLANDIDEPNGEEVYSLRLSERTIEMFKGDEESLTVKIYEDVELPIWWQSSNVNVVTVNNGVIKAVGEGTATIKAIVAGQVCSCAITVEANNVAEA